MYPRCMHTLLGCLMVVHVSQEKEPMGTAGPLALAHEILNDGSGAPFFVLNRCAQQPYGRARTHKIALGMCPILNLDALLWQGAGPKQWARLSSSSLCALQQPISRSWFRH